MTVPEKIELSTFYGLKAGMTRIFDEQGNHQSVTIIKLVPNFISQVKTKDKDGYEAYQIAFNEKREKLVSNPIKGHLKKASISKILKHFAEVKDSEINPENIGKEVSFESFVPATYVDVTGISKGKGFQGVIKRHGFQGGPAAHGSHFHRAPGSIGQCASPARVIKQKKMPGHMGDKKRTTQNLKILELNIDKGYLLVKGSVPGSKNSFVKISKALKKSN